MESRREENYQNQRLLIALLVAVSMCWAGMAKAGWKDRFHMGFQYQFHGNDIKQGHLLFGVNSGLGHYLELHTGFSSGFRLNGHDENNQNLNPTRFVSMGKSAATAFGRGFSIGLQYVKDYQPNSFLSFYSETSLQRQSFSNLTDPINFMDRSHNFSMDNIDAKVYSGQIGLGVRLKLKGKCQMRLGGNIAMDLTSFKGDVLAHATTHQVTPALQSVHSFKDAYLSVRPGLKATLTF